MSLVQHGVRLIVVADRDFVGDDERWLDVIERIGAGAQGRPVAVQVRAKSGDAHARETLAARARERVPADVPLILNGEAAPAERLRYAGVHWPEAAIPSGHPGTSLRFRTASIHSAEAARRAQQAGAETVLFGAVFAPRSHPGDAAGVQALQMVVESTDLDVFAIGGIEPDRVEDCIRVGATGVAVVSGVLGAPDVGAAIDEYVRAVHLALEGTRR